MSAIIKQDGFSYSFDGSKCQECGGHCCTGESGYIYVFKDEILDIAKFLKVDIEIFMSKYLFRHNGRYSLKETKIDNSYDCIFYNRAINGCAVYDVRPNQCKTFPFWSYFKNKIEILKLECPGIIDD